MKTMCLLANVKCRTPALVVGCCLLFAVACRREEQGSPVPVAEPLVQFNPALVSGERALGHVAELVALGPRVSGTEGAAAAASFLASRLRALGQDVVVDEFADASPVGEKTFRNVMCRIRGTGKGTIILGSHYDTKAGVGEDFEGANDSGSSTGLLLELAALFVSGPAPPQDILLVFFDGEECVRRYSAEDGLHGSRHLVRQLVDEGKTEDVRAVIVLDMVGDEHLSIGLPRNSTSELCAVVFSAADREGVRDRFSLGRQAIIDDHTPFLNAGMPAVDIIDFEFGAEPGHNDYWHTTEDTMDKLSADSLGIVGRITVHAVNAILDPDWK